MQAFRCALQVMRGNIVFLLVYIVGLSFMGVLMAQSFQFGDVEELLDQQGARGVEVSVVDRDGGELSKALGTFLEERAMMVYVDDSEQAFQDAVAKGEVDYLLIVPEGFGAAFETAVRTGATVPQMEVVYSYYAADGALLDEMVDAYLSCVRTLIIADPNAPLESVLAGTSASMAEHVDAQAISTDSGMSEADRFVFYLQWSTYTLFAGIVVCIGMLISTMNRSDVRRRNLASPMSYASYHGQLALACAVIAVASCAWTFALGLIAFPEAAVAISPERLALCILPVLMYSIMALSFGFMLGQFGVSALICNAFGNIFGMVVSFFGGAWVSLDLMSPEVMAIAHWLPGYWYTDACQLAVHTTSLQPVLLNVGVLLLFALAFMSIGFAVAKMRLQTSNAGGNGAAAVDVA